MDWRRLNFDWNRARAFLVTAEEGSLSAAARALGLAQPTLGRQVRALEEELDVVLFERIGRALVLTPSGSELLEQVRTMGEAAGRLSLVASGHALSLDGHITISASEVTSWFLLPPVLESLRLAHPGIHVELVASNAPSDLQRREADIAIRNFRPEAPGLVAKKIRDAAGHLYGTSEYIESLGELRTPHDLERAQFIGFNRGSEMIDGLKAMGLSLTQDHFVMVCENQLVQWEWVKRGLGLGVMQEEIGDAEAGVERVVSGLPRIVVPMWLTAHRELSTSRRLRVVFDHLYEGLRQPYGVED